MTVWNCPKCGTNIEQPDRVNGGVWHYCKHGIRRTYTKLQPQNNNPEGTPK